jgi:hypothetical protein
VVVLHVNYAVDVAKIRAARDRAIATAERELASLRAERDREIRRLRAVGLSLHAIGREVGCSASTVEAVLHPDRRAAANERRREYWHVYNAIRRAAVPTNDCAAGVRGFEKARRCGNPARRSCLV